VGDGLLFCLALAEAEKNAVTLGIASPNTYQKYKLMPLNLMAQC